ncbi:hypothetical protein AAY473_022267 [Plecturocebus cupreus]
MAAKHLQPRLPGRLRREDHLNPGETGFPHVGQAGLDLLTSGDPPALASQSAGITGVSHGTLPDSTLTQDGGVLLGSSLGHWSCLRTGESGLQFLLVSTRLTVPWSNPVTLSKLLSPNLELVSDLQMRTFQGTGESLWRAAATAVFILEKWVSTGQAQHGANVFASF